MPVIAITGGMASGKSAVTGMLKAKGAVIFDADKVVHEYYRDETSAVYKKLRKIFPQVFGEGGLSRAKLRKVVFSDNRKLRILERIVHPFVVKDLARWVEKNNKLKGIFAAEVPLLFEKKLNKYFDRAIVVCARESITERRLKNKFDAATCKILRRQKLQMCLREKMEKADFIIQNNSSLARLKKRGKFIMG